MSNFEKEMCGKNIFFVIKKNKIIMYHEKKIVGEIEINDKGNIIATKAFKKKYFQNIIFYINLHKELTIEDLHGFQNKYIYLDQIKERLHPDLLLKYAIKCKSTNLVKYAMDREAILTNDTFIESAIHSNKILLIHFQNGFEYFEKLFEIAFLHKNYQTIKILARKTNNLENYISRCNEENEYQMIKKILIKELIYRNKT